MEHSHEQKKRRTGILIALGVVLAVLLISTVVFSVDETRDVVLVTRFGKIDRVIDGRDDPGLHFKWFWPIEQTVRYDSRQQILVDSYRQLRIGEYSVVATVFATWRIADPSRFYRAKETVAEASHVLSSLLADEVKDVLGTARMDQLINTDPEQLRLAEMENKILKGISTRAMNDYGLQVTSLGIRSLTPLQETAKTIIEAMKKDREREISTLRAQGKSEADAIVARATSARDTILAFAERQAARIRAQGQAQAARSYSQFRENPEFAMFLRSLESLKTQLKDRTIFFLDKDTFPALQWLSRPPSLETFRESSKRESKKK